MSARRELAADPTKTLALRFDISGRRATLAMIEWAPGAAPLGPITAVPQRNEGGVGMTTRVATGARSAWLAGLLATALAVPALAASETTAERLLNAGAEPQNWLHPSQGLCRAPLLHARPDQQGQRQGSQGRLDLRARRHRGRRHLAARRPRGHADRRGRLHVRHRRLGLGLQARHQRRARASWSGRWTRAPTRTGRARCPAAASTTAASRCGRTR